MLCSVLGLWCPQIDAFYYPSKSDLSVHEEHLNVGTLDACRDIVYRLAAANDDPKMVRGDYECGISPQQSYGDLRVYQETVR